MLKQSTFIVCLSFLMLLFSSCEKVIDFDLANADEKIVIEGFITNNRLPFSVLVSKTSSYFGSAKRNPVSGAKVSVRAEKGNRKYFQEVEPGNYQLKNALASTGYWYVLDVEYEGVVYSARSFLNPMVPITNLSFSYVEGFGFFDSGYKVTTYIRDPVNSENYYRLKYFVNNQAASEGGEITIYSDQLFNGKEIGLSQRSTVFNENDTLTVELQSIDKSVYDYFSTLESISGKIMQQTASPTNPISNFNNGALGYFSAYTFDRKKVIVKDFINK